MYLLRLAHGVIYFYFLCLNVWLHICIYTTCISNEMNNPWDLRSSTALVEDLAHTRQLETTCNFTSRASSALFWIPQTFALTHRHFHTQTHVIKIKKNIGVDDVAQWLSPCCFWEDLSSVLAPISGSSQPSVQVAGIRCPILASISTCIYLVYSGKHIHIKVI